MGDEKALVTRKEWFAVRCIFSDSADHVWTRNLNLRQGETAYEERITLWFAGDAEAAIKMAEDEASEYAETLDTTYVGFASSYRMPEPPGHGREVFSLIRTSQLSADEYLNQFFDTGDEVTSKVEHDSAYPRTEDSGRGRTTP